MFSYVDNGRWYVRQLMSKHKLSRRAAVKICAQAAANIRRRQQFSPRFALIRRFHDEAYQLLVKARNHSDENTMQLILCKAVNDLYGLAERSVRRLDDECDILAKAWLARREWRNQRAFDRINVYGGG